MAPGNVVLVNGLWLNNAALWPLARRLRAAGYRVFPFSYPSVRSDLRANAERLQRFLSRVPAGDLHWVGYSLGGILIRALFHYHPQQRPGRLVLLGSPQQGSAAAEQIMRSGWGRRIAGRSLADLVAGRPHAWGWPNLPTGVIAGSRPMGLGRFVARLSAASDGTVLVEETRVPGEQDRLVMPVAHSVLLLSPAVCQQVIRFLQTGQFDHG